MFTAESTPGNIVKEFPKASDLFKQYDINFCCGGHVPLKETFSQKALDGNAILTELNTAYENWSEENHDTIDWDSKSLSEIIDHIQTNYHQPLMSEFPALGEFVAKVYNRHGATHPELEDVYTLYHQLQVEMEKHTTKENNEVFPRIKQYESQSSEELLNQIRSANDDLEKERNTVSNILNELRKVTNDFQPPADACGSYQITYRRLEELEENTLQHIHLENNILFTRL